MALGHSNLRNTPNLKLNTQILTYDSFFILPDYFFQFMH